jgi:hypothetical protein
MIDFSTTTTFEVVRRVAAAGLATPSIYVLICEPGELGAVQEDLAAEIEVQLGSELRSLDASNITFDVLFEATAHANGPGIVLLAMRRWEQNLVDSIDRNIVLLTDSGPLILLTSFDVAERILAKAPNLRSRLADVLLIGPDEALGGAH